MPSSFKAITTACVLNSGAFLELHKHSWQSDSASCRKPESFRRPNRNGNVPRWSCLEKPWRAVDLVHMTSKAALLIVMPPSRRKRCAAEQVHKNRGSGCTPYAEHDCVNDIFHAYRVTWWGSHAANKARGHSYSRARRMPQPCQICVPCDLAQLKWMSTVTTAQRIF